MLILLSPAKTQNFDRVDYPAEPTQAAFLERSEKLITTLRKKSKPQLKKLLGVSDSLIDLNKKRYMDWSLPFTKDNAKPAIFVYTGDVYHKMHVADFSQEDLVYAQDNLRILSGLYGILKPMDLIQAYRLELSTKIKIGTIKNLYEFWKETITEMINEECSLYDHKVILNLASNEYVKVLDKKKLALPLIDVTFKEKKDGKYKVFGMVGRPARGLMARYLIKNKVLSLDDAKKFKDKGYSFMKSMSFEAELVFGRDWQYK